MTLPQVKIVLEEMQAFTGKVMAALALQILANLTASPARGGTPVDTGWARANWVPNVGSPITSTVGSRPTSSARGRDSGGRFTGGAKADTAGIVNYRFGSGPIYITNNVPYIEALNAGWSAQAPAGFIQAAVARAAKTVARGKR